MTAYSDDFNRADSSTSAGSLWTNRNGVVGVSSNAAYPVTASAYDMATFNTALGSNDMTVSIVLGSLVSSNDLPISIIGADTVGVCVLVLWGATTTIYSNAVDWTANNATSRASGAVSYTTADTLTVSRVGNVYSCSKNGGGALVSWTDSGNVVPRDSSHRLTGVGGFNSAGSYRTVNSWTASDTAVVRQQLIINRAPMRASHY